MKFLGLALAMLAYGYACFSVFRLYVYLISLGKKNIEKKVIRIVFSYALFSVLILPVIPFAIFFPAWLNEEFSFVAHTSASTAILILFGCAMLAFTGWAGGQRRRDQA